ncbi:DUF2079 domain-containing protein [Candidatus Saganbacteria bacterium]|nr:DUF2079 domain-containing protein [Candidatus Saganbacteria bacterium]
MKRLWPQLPFYCLCLAIGFYAVSFSIFSILDQLNFNPGCHDVGQYDQIIWLISRGFGAITSLGNSHLFSFHVSGYCFLLAPLFWLWDSVNMLYIAQAFFLGLTAVPVFFQARAKLNNAWLAFLIGLFLLYYPALQNMNLENFHPEALIIFPFAFALHFMFQKNWPWFYGSVALAMIGKEEMSIVVLVMGIYMLLFMKEYRRGLVIILLGLLYYLLCMRVIMPLANGLSPFSPAKPFVYSHWFGDYANNIFNFNYYWTSFTSPDALRYYQQLLAPVLYLPLLSPPALFLGLPSLAINVLSRCGYFMSVNFHYNYVLIVVIFFALIESLAAISRWLGAFKYKTWALISIIILLSMQTLRQNQLLSHASLARIPAGIKHLSDPGMAARRAGLALIPATAKASVSYSLFPQVSHRRELYLFPTPFQASYWGEINPLPTVKDHVDYIGLALGNHCGLDERRIVRFLQSSSWFKEIYREKDVVILKRQAVKTDSQAGALYTLYDGIGQQVQNSGRLSMIYFPGARTYFRNLLGESLPVSGPFVLEISGQIFLPQSGDYRFELSGSGTNNFKIDNQYLSEKRYFAAGIHSFAIKQINSAQNWYGLQLLVHPPQGDAYIVSDRHLWHGLNAAAASRILRSYQSRQTARQVFEARQPNLLKNGGFENIKDDQPEDWRIEKWQEKANICVNKTENIDRKSGFKAAVNIHLGKADSRWVQEVLVKPRTYYHLSGWIKTSGVGPSGQGACINVDDSVFRTEVLSGSQAWRYVEVIGRTDSNQTCLKVQCRLGYFGMPNTGTAYFDDIKLKEILPPDYE